ncbi:hypothetical protein K438DRAFT_613661 [Mycena galopus ATCC 62051]|nr:hypothetical protein K438DRAFT_613661 [Mycena galopus ATCC 62051]
MDNDATPAESSSRLPHRRVLPSRPRRGAAGVGNAVGNSDVDLMILNAQVNKLENEPLIPADTPFVLKTNNTLAAVAAEFSSAGGSALNHRAHESYFDRPEVLKAYREQTTIETPEFTNLSETPSASVGGPRLRVRTTEDNTADLDAVYEKRHKKYEKFEKGQRLREKEKLKHAQYKLKERIEQLRGMDNSAFMAAPASAFSAPSGPEVMEEDPILGGLNGNPAFLEGERRRKEMLANAQILEERYRILLPPDRQKKPAGQNLITDLDSELSGKEFVRQDEESDLDEQTALVHKKESQKVKIKLPARPNIAASPVTTPKATPMTSTKKRPQSSKPAAVRKPKTHHPSTTTPQIPSMGEPGPSSLVEPLQTSFDGTPHTSIPPIPRQEELMPSCEFWSTGPHPSARRNNGIPTRGRKQKTVGFPHPETMETLPLLLLHLLHHHHRPDLFLLHSMEITPLRNLRM